MLRPSNPTLFMTESAADSIAVKSLLCNVTSSYMKIKTRVKQSELEEQQATLTIHESEEVPFKGLLNFMYSDTLPVKTAPSLLDVLKAVDKFEVESCMRYCSRLLERLPVTCDSALLYPDLRSSVRMVDAVQSLTDTATKFLAEYGTANQPSSEQESAGRRSLLGTPWTTFMADDSIYFINSFLHLQAKLIVRKQH